MVLSVVIRTYNEEKHIAKLIHGIKEQDIYDPLKVEIIIVDSGSQDETREIAKSLGAKVLVIDKSSFSFGRSLNVGCNNALGNILVFASAHVFPTHSDWLARLLNPFDDEKVGLVYGRQIGDVDSRFSEKMIFKSWFPSESNMNQITPFCNNANCAIRKKEWLDQPFDEDLTGLEDIDWAKKAMAKGLKVVYVSEAIIVHVHNESSKKILNRYRREAIALKRIMPDLNIGLFRAIMLFTFNVSADIRMSVKLSCFWRDILDIILFRFLQFYGTYLGHQQKGGITKELKTRFYYPNLFEKQQLEGDSETRNATKKIEYN
jgi:rhamnosyltransferase